MKTSRRFAALLSTLSLAGLAACGSSTPTPDNATASPSASAASATTTAEPTSTGSTAATTATASASSGPTTSPPTSGDVAKDPNPLVVELKVEASKGTLADADVDKMRTTFLALVAVSTKVTLASSKDAPTKRRILLRLIVDPVVEAKDKLSDKLSVKIAMNAVTLDGHCPLFDLRQKAEMQRSSKEAGDEAAVRNAAVQLIFAQLEAEQSKLKPDAQCLADKPAGH